MSNPTVNQIESAYQFQPQKLGQKVEQDKRQNGGLPRDLRQLMALNDINQGNQNMGIQQALQVPTNMPTVAQDIQERARQALQARMMQQVQEQQRKNGQPPVVPAGVPKPPMQAQGIDSLETNVGTQYAAEGGIIGHTQHFDGQSSSFVQDIASLKDKLVGAFTETDEEKAARVLQQKLQQEGAPIGYFTKGADEYKEKSALRDFVIANPNLVKSEEFQKDPMGFMQRATSVSKEKPQVYTPSAAADASETSKLMRMTPMGQDQRTAATPPAAPPRPPTSNTTATKPPRPPGGLTDLVAPKPEVDTEAMQIEKKVMRRDADAEALKLAQQYEKEVGKKDTSQYDRLIAELENRKKSLEGPQDSFGRLKEYLAQFEGARTWQEAGSKASAKLTGLQKERAQEQFDLTKQAIDIAAKKNDAEYDYKKGIFDLKSGEKKRVYDQAYDAAKAVGKAEAEAKKWAEEQVLRQQEMKNRMAVANVNHDQLLNRAKALMAADKTLTLETAMQKASLAADAGKLSIADTRAGSAADATRAKIAEKYAWIDMLPNNDPTKKMMAAERDKRLAAVGSGAGLPNAVPSPLKGQVQFLGYE
jgi:hypothetical protein